MFFCQIRVLARFGSNAGSGFESGVGWGLHPLLLPTKNIPTRKKRAIGEGPAPGRSVRTRLSPVKRLIETTKRTRVTN